MASGSTVYVPSFIKIDAGFQAILRFGSESLEVIIMALLKKGFMNYTVEMR
jgi:hypothetical protein